MCLAGVISGQSCTTDTTNRGKSVITLVSDNLHYRVIHQIKAHNKTVLCVQFGVNR